MCLFRRFLVLIALFFWQGGFTFYASVVVPIGQATLGHLEQGFITRQVTNYLNLSGGIALLALAWDIAAGRDTARRRRLGRWLAWAVMAVGLGILVWLHGRLDQLLDVDAMQVMDRTGFRRGHRLYLWVSTVQWAAALAFALVSLRAWQAEDTLQAEAVSFPPEFIDKAAETPAEENV
jgi:hypothetical protein